MAAPPRRPRTRFAPSPTGHLHLGHVAHMLYVWGFAGLQDAEVLLRIEDHDRQRCKPRYEADLLRDLDWLGFEPSNALTGATSPFRQSDCEAVYAAALRDLGERWQVYRCVCTRKMLAAVAPAGPHGERPYPGTCRDARHPDSVPHGLRVGWDPRAPAESFRDAILGPQLQEPRTQCGDLLLKDRHGHWTYQFAVVVDDLRHGVDFVVRGADLLESTGRQLRLAKMLGAAALPRYYHHPLVRRGGEKLGKRKGAPPIRDLRAEGARPADVLGAAAETVGLVPERRPVHPREAAGLVERAHQRARLAKGADSRL